MSQCEYVGPSGRQCAEEATEGQTICFWHDREADKTADDIKEHLEKKARATESCEGYELMRANLEDARIMELDLSHANLERANLQGGHSWGVNLTGANLMKANLRDANLRESKLEGTDLLGANLDGADLDRRTGARAVSSVITKLLKSWNFRATSWEHTNSINVLKTHIVSFGNDMRPTVKQILPARSSTTKWFANGNRCPSGRSDGSGRKGSI